MVEIFDIEWLEVLLSVLALIPAAISVYLLHRAAALPSLPDQGMSRRSWYRRNKLRTGTVGTTSSAALLSDVHADESVPRTYENLSDDLRILALGLLSHTESAWSELERGA